MPTETLPMKPMKTNNPRPRWLLLALFIFHFSFFILHPASAAPPLSPQARVSLITFGPGEDLYSVFGHTAIHIADPLTGLERVYNYGEFDFTTDNFYVKFLRGTLPYQIGVDDMYRTVYTYQYFNRSIREQALALSPGQRQRLYDALEDNLRPENREYRYKFYYDNCATRPRDMLTRAVADSLQWPASLQQTTKPFRAWMNDYLGEKPWAKLGMNLAIGWPADLSATGWQAMYLPNNVFSTIAQARIRQPNGGWAPLVSNTRTIFEANKPFRQQVPLWQLPDFFFALFTLGVALFTARRYVAGYVDRWLDRWLFGFVGVCGWFLLLLWVATDHGVTGWNPTLLWLLPFHMPLIFWITGRQRSVWLRRLYFVGTAALIVLGLFLSQVPGGVDTMFGLMLLVRCLVNLNVARATRGLSVQTTSLKTA